MNYATNAATVAKHGFLLWNVFLPRHRYTGYHSYVIV